MALPIYNNKYLGDFNGRRPRPNPITKMPERPRPNPITQMPQPPRRPITPMPNPKLPQPPRRPPNFGRPNPMPAQPVSTAPAPPVDNKSPFANIEDAAKWAALNGWVKSPSPVGGNATPPAPVGTTPAKEDARAKAIQDAMNEDRRKAEEAARRRREQPGVKYQDEMY